MIDIVMALIYPELISEEIKGIKKNLGQIQL